MRYLLRLSSVAVLIIALGIAAVTMPAARPVSQRTQPQLTARGGLELASYVPKWPQDYADSPCSKKNFKSWVKTYAEYPGYSPEFYNNQAFCALPISMICLAQQYNRSHNTHVPFYTNRTFYIRCQQAYTHIRLLRHARPARWSACDIIGWGSVLAAPFLPEESLIQKGAALVGIGLKVTNCGG